MAVFGIIFVLAAGTVFGGLYLYKKPNQKPEETPRLTTILPKNWLVKYFGVADENDARVGGIAGDPDDDLLSNLQEYNFGTDPTKHDTDNDGAWDAIEIAFNQNPNGPGELQLSADALAQVDQYISEHEELAEFSQDKIFENAKNFFQADRALVLDLPEEKELRVTAQNDQAGFEKYYNDTQGLSVEDPGEAKLVQAGLFEMSDEDIDRYVGKMRTIVKLLKEIPVPSEILTIHKLKIAQVNAGIRLFELVRDNYDPATENQNLWADIFYQTVAATEAGTLELAAWQEIGEKLKDQGGT